MRWSKHSDRADLTHLSATALARGDLNGIRTCVFRDPARDDRSSRHSGRRDRGSRTAVALDPRQPCDGGRLLICNRGLADVDPKLEQFAVNPWRSPQQVGNAHLANDMAKGDTK